MALLSNAQKISPIKTEIKAIFWLQGEADAKNDDRYLSYEENLLNLVDRYRKDLNNPELPFIACTIGSFLHKKRFTHSDEINKILLSLPSKRMNTACVDARDITETIGDKVHFSTKAQKEIGKRFADAYLKLTDSKINESKKIKIEI